MGNSRWNDDDWKTASAKTRGLSQSEIFNSSSLKKEMDPRGIKLRESRDSAANPNSTPIILALDETGSMGDIAVYLAKDGLGTLVQQILDRKPVSDPHIMVMGVGDVRSDRAPLQVSQFEADIRIADQLKELYLEGNGGGNGSESYTLPWYFAAQKTDIDCVKHGRKGLLFTFGDEPCPPPLTRAQIKQFIGDTPQQDFTAKELYEMVSEKYDVFHVVIEQGSGINRYGKSTVYDSWNDVLPKGRVISATDYTKIPQIITSVMEVHAGKAPQDVIDSWQGADRKVVQTALKDVKPGVPATLPANQNAAMKPLQFKKPTP
jgi:hypothetical protein